MSKAAELAALIGSQSALSNRNLIINGAMEVDQRNATTTMGAVTYGLDRFTCFKSHDGVQTMVQSTDAPVGFKNSLKVTTTTADASLAAGQRSAIIYRIEAQDNAHLEFGTANAKRITLSFYVKSSITGTHGGAFGNGADNRNYPFTYTISSADTWERKIISIPGDTTGTWATDNGRGLQIVWGLGVGSTYSGTAGAWAAGDINSATGATTGVTNTLNATWLLTGVQLEVGEQATPFEHRSFGDELHRCMRYYQQIGGGHGKSPNTTMCDISVVFNPPMRSNPAVTDNGTVIQITNVTAADFNQSSVGVSDTDTGVTDGVYGGGRVRLSNFSGLTGGDQYSIDHTASQGGAMVFDAEL